MTPPYDSNQEYLETDDMAPDCFGDYQPGAPCDLCPLTEECR